MISLKVKQRPVFEWPLFFQKKHKQKYKQINRKFSKMEMMNKCHFFGAISRKKENPRQATPSCAPLK